MSFNFYDQYSQASTVELLKIISDPDAYQSQAVEAATRVLSERNISEEEQLEANEHFEKIAEKKQSRERRKQQVQEKTESLLEPLFEQTEGFSAKKWVYFIVIAIGLQFIVVLVSNFHYFSFIVKEFFGCISQRVDGFFDCLVHFFDLYTLIFVISSLLPLLYIYLLIKRKRWGWILLFADVMLSLGSIVLSGFLSYYHPSLDGIFDIRTGIYVFIKIGIGYCLWRKEMTTYFSISQDTKLFTLLAGIGLGIVLRMFG